LRSQCGWRWRLSAPQRDSLGHDVRDPAQPGRYRGRDADRSRSFRCHSGRGDYQPRILGPGERNVRPGSGGGAMNMLKKGPELKKPDVKVPDFLLDIYYDLRERHLLPLVALLIVAIVAVPFLLGGSSESDSEEAEGAIATPSSVIPSSKLVVAKSAPGL